MGFGGQKTRSRSIGGVIWNGLRFPLKKWSATGLRFGPASIEPAPYAHLRLQIILQGRLRLTFEATAQVMACGNGSVGCRYWPVRARDAAVIDAFLTGRQAGTTALVAPRGNDRDATGVPMLTTHGLLPKHYVVG